MLSYTLGCNVMRLPMALINIRVLHKTYLTRLHGDLDRRLVPKSVKHLLAPLLFEVLMP